MDFQTFENVLMKKVKPRQKTVEDGTAIGRYQQKPIGIPDQNIHWHVAWQVEDADGQLDR